jgi:hypothetical protein
MKTASVTGKWRLTWQFLFDLLALTLQFALRYLPQNLKNLEINNFFLFSENLKKQDADCVCSYILNHHCPDQK